MRSNNFLFIAAQRAQHVKQERLTLLVGKHKTNRERGVR